MSFSIAIEEPQPSQLFIDAQRLRSALDWFDFDTVSYDPIPGLYLDEELILTDGHTRAFLAYLGGATSLEMVHDPDKSELNIPLYRQCVGWCRDESIADIGDLVGRVVSRQTFLDRWVTRCQQSPYYAED